jgi:hypothetical protein
MAKVCAVSRRAALEIRQEIGTKTKMQTLFIHAADDVKK